VPATSLSRHVIAERYAEFEITGPSEIREVDRTSVTSIRQMRSFESVGNVRAVIAVARSAAGERRRVVVAGVAL
jgi:hypothetical protein